MTYLETSEPNEFDAFETFGGLTAFIFHKYGADGLRQVFAVDTESENTFTREFLEDTANELAALDLNKAAAIVADVAATKPSMLDLCPYDTDTADGRSWLANTKSQLKRRQRGLGRHGSQHRRPNE